MSGYQVYCRNPHGRTGAAQPIKTHETFGRALFHLNACYRRYGTDCSGDIYGIATIPSDEETTVQIRTGHPHPIAYMYQADHHCPGCAAARFGVDENGSIPAAATDGEGNPIGAVAPWDEWIEPSTVGVQVLTCGTCGAEIDRYEDVDEIERAADAAGYEAGTAAGGWMIDGNTTEEAARAIIRGIEEGDPAVLDQLPSAPLSGEWADGLLPRDVLRDYGMTEDHPAADDVLRAYEDGYDRGALDEVCRAAYAILPS